MIDMKFLDDIAKKINDAMPNSVKEMKKDMEQNVKTILQSTFAKLDLVTREEFDAQVRVLARTRAKLTELEKQVAELEKKNEKRKVNK
jgi:BMFP domain-containing protein YqiC